MGLFALRASSPYLLLSFFCVFLLQKLCLIFQEWKNKQSCETKEM